MPAAVPVPLATGYQINASNEADNRFVFPTVLAALTDGATVDGQPKPRIAGTRRYEGLAVWITEEQKLYRFIGGTADTNFVPDLAATEAITAIIESLFESETLTELLIEKLFESETFVETLIEKLFEDHIETVTEKLFASDEWKEAMNDYWSKTELLAKTETDYNTEKATIPAGTVVLVKED